MASILSDMVSNSEAIDLTDLCVHKEKLVWVLYCDLVCLDYDGCILDAAIIALMAALRSRKSFVSELYIGKFNSGGISLLPHSKNTTS